MCFMFASLMFILHGFKFWSELAYLTPIAFGDFKTPKAILDILWML